MTDDFYDALTPLYHLIYPDWSDSIRVQGGQGSHYDLGFYVVTEDLATQAVRTRVMRSRYYAIATERLCELMREAGLAQVRRIDGTFFQPVLVGTRPGVGMG